MQIVPRIPAGPSRHPSAKARILPGAHMGGVVRRMVKDVEREIGRDALIREVRRRGFHLVECGDQFIIICNPAKLRVHV